MNHLTEKKAVFWSKFTEQICWPCGVPHTGLVKGPDNVHSQHIIAKPEVRFEHHRYQTKDPEIAAGLVGNEANFGKPWGWSLEPGCLPESIREIYTELPLEEKRKVALALIEGKTPDDAFEMIDPEAVERAKEATGQAVGSEQYIIQCPVCGLTAGGDMPVQDINSSMTAHIAAMHPDYEGEPSGE